ncbi:MAG: TIGR02234 family membrane protein [Mycobacteriales bacterium]
MTARRGLVVAVALCLVGAGLVLLATSRPWLSYSVGAVAPLPSRRLVIAGARLAPGARVLGLVGLAGVAALPASQRFGRIAVGVVLTLTGAGLLLDLIRVLRDPLGAAVRAEPPGTTLPGSTNLGGWPFVALLGGLLILGAGVLVVLRGRRWEELSARFDAPSEPPPPGEASLWDALDRGEDPTG